MKASKKSTITAIFALISLAMVMGCGGDYADFTHNAPDGSTINFDPGTINITAIGDTWHDISLTVRDKDNKPLNGIKVIISGPFAFPYDPLHYYFYNSTKTVLYSSGFTGVTDSGGAYNFTILVPASSGTGSNVFTEKIEARSGTAYDAMDVSKN